MNFDDAVQLITANTKQNNEWSSQEAIRQMDFQREMSDSAHQREVADLQAAGLNPVLSAGGSGASTPTGAKGDVDTSGTAALVNIMELFADTIQSQASSSAAIARAINNGEADGTIDLASALETLKLSGGTDKDSYQKIHDMVEQNSYESHSKVLGFLNNVLYKYYPKTATGKALKATAQTLLKNSEEVARKAAKYTADNPTPGTGYAWVTNYYNTNSAKSNNFTHKSGRY